jgi:hypothetical protein
MLPSQRQVFLVTGFIFYEILRKIWPKIMEKECCKRTVIRIFDVLQFVFFTKKCPHNISEGHLDLEIHNKQTFSVDILLIKWQSQEISLNSKQGNDL